MEIIINKKTDIPIYRQIEKCILDKILKKEIIGGFKLPSQRSLSMKLGVHRNTVDKAYQELIEQDYVEFNETNKTYFIKSQQYNTVKIKKHHYDPFDYYLKEDMTTLNAGFNKIFNKGNEDSYISFAGEIPSPETFPKNEVAEILKEIAEESPDEIFSYGLSQGFLELRQNICNMLKDFQINATPSEVHIITETTECIANAISLYLSPGDSVILETPSLIENYNKFLSEGIKPLSVDVDDDGIVIEHLEHMIKKNNPKLMYTTPSMHTPTGTDMSLERRLKLLDLSYEYNIPIIEEDFSHELSFKESIIPSLKAMDSMGHVIYTSSFTFSVYPGVRLGFLVAPKSVTSSVAELMNSSNLCLNGLSQKIVSRFIEKGLYKKHVQEIKTYYRKKRDIMADCLDSINDIDLHYKLPEGATGIWLRIPDDMSQSLLLSNADKLGVGFMPGYFFYPQGEYGSNHIRLSFLEAPQSKIGQGIDLLHQAMKNTAMQQQK